MAKLPKIALGAWAWGNDGTFGNSLTAESLKPIFDTAMANGLNLWDTAYAYGMGTSEKVLAGFLKGLPRESYLVSDKFTPQCADTSSPTAMADMIEMQLKLMELDHFDVYWIHNVWDAPKWTEELAKYFKPNTKALFGETITNPTVSILDIEKFARLAHSHNVPLIIDNTFATPINCRPFEWGADIVTHSTTKYMDGHAVGVGGCIVDSGNFDWMAHKEKFPGLTTPDESYHGITYAERFGKGAYITKATAQLMRDFGAIQSPQNAFYLNLGLETLHLRMAKHCENAKKIAAYLKAHEKVAWVHYADLEDDAYHALAQKYMPQGTCGVLAFAVKGGREEAIAFMDRMQLASIVTHVADAKSCLLHPASHTHRQMSDEQLREAGVAPDLIRLSIGIEDVEDLIADLEQALA